MGHVYKVGRQVTWATPDWKDRLEGQTIQIEGLMGPVLVLTVWVTGSQLPGLMHCRVCINHKLALAAKAKS